MPRRGLSKGGLLTATKCYGFEIKRVSVKILRIPFVNDVWLRAVKVWWRCSFSEVPYCVRTGPGMSGISALGGIQHPHMMAAASTQRVNPDAVQEPKRVTAPDKGTDTSGTLQRRTATGDTIAADLAARSSASDPSAHEDALKRALIGKVFKVDETTDLKSMFGEIQFTKQDMDRASNFMKNLAQLRPDPVQPGDVPRVNLTI